MTLSFTGRKRIRKDFGRISSAFSMPNLIEVQKSSYDGFLQKGVSAEERTDTGLQGVFKSVFPIKDFSESAELHFVKYELEEPKYDTDECQQRDMTYAAPLKVALRLIVFEVDEETDARSILDIKEQDVYMGDMPLMTDNGTFIINGTERVIVSQMHRSPGVFFDHDKGKTHSSGKFLFAARVIPYRGSWLDFEFDAKDILHVRIDRRRKLPATTLLYALEMSDEGMLDYFYDTVAYVRDPKRGWKTRFTPERMRGLKATRDFVNAKNGRVVIGEGTKITGAVIRKLDSSKIEDVLVPAAELAGRYVAGDIINESTGEVFVEAGEELNEENIEALEEAGVTEIQTLDIDHISVGPYIRNTMVADKVTDRARALIEIYRVMRPGEPPTEETAENLFKSLFFDPERYDLSPVGRVKMNASLGFEVDESVRVLRKEDIPGRPRQSTTKSPGLRSPRPGEKEEEGWSPRADASGLN